LLPPRIPTPSQEVHVTPLIGGSSNSIIDSSMKLATTEDTEDTKEKSDFKSGLILRVLSVLRGGELALRCRRPWHSPNRALHEIAHQRNLVPVVAQRLRAFDRELAGQLRRLLVARLP